MSNELSNQPDLNGAHNAASSQPDGATRLEHLVDEKAFAEFLKKNYPREAAVYQRAGMNRRSFLKLMGASLAMSGLGLTGCSAFAPNEEILPYARMPENLVPGKPLFFATSMPLGGYANGMLIETHEGRPTRVEGNPRHPASLGSISAVLQAAILDLYNPVRSIRVQNQGTPTTWDAFVAALDEALPSDGAGVRILTETVTSPTLARQIAAVQERLPQAQWHQYEPINRDAALAGAELAFGEAVSTVYRFDEAEVVVSLDADFLMDMPGSVRYARDFASRRRVRADNPTMSRLYVIEGGFSVTGAAADHRLALRPAQIENFARALAAALGVSGVSAPSGTPWSGEWFDALVADLQASEGRSLIVPGDGQTPAVHALAHAINAALGAVGTTLNYLPPIEANPVIQSDDLATLVSDMAAGNVQVLIILDGNPVYNAPVDLDFAGALAQVPFSAHLSLYLNETSEVTAWHVPGTHFIEEWGDALAFDGTASVLQPPIGPLYETVRSGSQMLALLAGDDRTPYEILQETWASQLGEDGWRRALHDGTVADSAPAPITPSLQSLNLGAAPSADGLDVLFRVDPAIYDGRFNQISWLQELPDPLTKITWDNSLMVSPATAERLGLVEEQLAEVNLGGNVLAIPVFILAGMPDDTLATYLGYGGGLSADLDAGLAFNAYQLMPNGLTRFFSGASVENTGRGYNLAQSRVPELDENLWEADDRKPVVSATLAAFQTDPDGIYTPKYEDPASILPDFLYEDNAWGMTIDLTSCIGCNACVIACQMENSIPTVGKDEVARGRDMSWIRIDPYEIPDGDETRHAFQPVPCMHCEKAPCEIVCPVQATVHDHEGLNLMVYNRCVGTRYCSANCPYNVRRFNYLKYVDEAPVMEEWRNPNVTVRVEGVMEKCTYCVQRIAAANIEASKENRPVRDGEVTPACASACPTQAIIFGNINDPEAAVTKAKAEPHEYKLLAELNVKPRTSYLAKLYNPNEELYESGQDEE